jgi:hypothetical protein
MACNGNCGCSCNKEEDWRDVIWDESGFPLGAAGPLKYEPNMTAELNLDDEGLKLNLPPESNAISYKYAEDKILADLKEHLDKTYSGHYMTENDKIECFDAWIALGDSTPTFRNTALKYLWRYGKKNGNNKKDLMKAMHYIFMCLYVDHYKDDN